MHGTLHTAVRWKLDEFRYHHPLDGQGGGQGKAGGKWVGPSQLRQGGETTVLLEHNPDASASASAKRMAETTNL
jgi:hypothetical protein